MAIDTWLTPYFVTLPHTVGNDKLIDFTMFLRFINSATELSPEYFIMLLSVNEDLTIINQFQLLLCIFHLEVNLQTTV